MPCMRVMLIPCYGSPPPHCHAPGLRGAIAHYQCTIMYLGLHQTLQHAVDKGIEAYITSRRARIPVFIAGIFLPWGARAALEDLRSGFL